MKRMDDELNQVGENAYKHPSIISQLILQQKISIKKYNLPKELHLIAFLSKAFKLNFC